eukprot:1254957-Rhodomonas_salina.1
MAVRFAIRRGASTGTSSPRTLDQLNTLKQQQSTKVKAQRFPSFLASSHPAQSYTHHYPRSTPGAMATTATSVIDRFSRPRSPTRCERRAMSASSGRNPRGGSGRGGSERGGEGGGYGGGRRGSGGGEGGWRGEGGGWEGGGGRREGGRGETEMQERGGRIWERQYGEKRGESRREREGGREGKGEARGEGRRGEKEEREKEKETEKGGGKMMHPGQINALLMEVISLSLSLPLCVAVAVSASVSVAVSLSLFLSLSLSAVA